jgi:hypothetical protein
VLSFPSNELVGCDLRYRFDQYRRRRPIHGALDGYREYAEEHNLGKRWGIDVSLSPGFCAFWLDLPIPKSDKMLGDLVVTFFDYSNKEGTSDDGV